MYNHIGMLFLLVTTILRMISKTDIDHNIQYQPDTEDTDIEEFEEEAKEEVHHWQPLDCWVVEDQWMVVEHIGNQ